MRKLITILFVLFFPVLCIAQSSNAGADVTIYLTQTNAATLDGSASSGTTYQWREISTDFSSGGTITSPTSKTTTVTGLTKQGTFYFELAATTGGVTKKDSMVLRVNYDVPPTGTLSNNFAMDNSRISNVINWRGDTTSFFPDSDMTHSQVGDSDTYTNSTNWWILYRDRVNNMMIDSLRGKLTTTIQDGYGNGSMINGTQVKYPRTEVVIDKPSSIDTSHIYMYEWKGYYPNQTNYMTGNNAITTIFQIHADSSYGENTMDMSLKADGTLTFTLFPNGSREQKYAIGTLSDWTNKSHTLRLTIREGYGAPGNPAFMKLEIDGNQVVVRDTGRIGGTPGGNFGDFAKFGTLYDYGNAMVDANATGGTRKFSLVTESLKRYALTSVAPLTNAGDNQIILLPTTSATLSGNVVAVTSAIASYQWTKLSGGSATIANQNSLSTSVTGLSKGIYVFNLQATDVNGLQSSSTVQVIVDSNRTIAATGYNYDVLVDGVLNGTVSSLRNHDIDGSGFSFYVNGFSPNSTPLPSAYALPTTGVIISPTNTRYQLQPYNANNALWLDNSQSGTLTLSTPASFNKIKIALTSGGTSVTYKINYSDGTNTTVSHSINNWACQGCAFYAINNLGRVDGTGALETTYWAIYEDSISPNPAKIVNSITFTSTGSWVSVFALTNVPSQLAAIMPLQYLPTRTKKYFKNK